MTQLKWSHLARRDLDSIQQYMLQEMPEYWLRFIEQTEAATRFLLATPGAGTMLRGGIHKWRLGRTRYLIFYRIDGGDLRVLRVVHDKRDWQRFLG